MNMGMGMGKSLDFSSMSAKMQNQFFRPVEGVVWDLASGGGVGINTPDGIASINMEDPDDPGIEINLFDQMAMAVPAFAKATGIEEVKVGDLIMVGAVVKGWVVEVITPKEAKTAKAKADPAVKPPSISFKILTPTGSVTTFKPPKVTSFMFGASTGSQNVMVISSLFNILPDGATGVNDMSNMLMQMFQMQTMFDGDMDLEGMMPMILMSSMSGGASGGMGGMMNMMMMKNMFSSNTGGNKAGNSFFNKT